MADEMTFTFDHNPLTDVMFVDVRPLDKGAHISVVDIGDSLGFPGQVQLRVDLENEVVYGIIIQNYGGFRRKLVRSYRMWSVQRAIELLIHTLLAGLNFDSHNRRRPMLA